MRQRQFMGITLFLAVFLLGNTVIATERKLHLKNDNDTISAYLKRKENEQFRTIVLREELTPEWLSLTGYEKVTLTHNTQDLKFKQKIFQETATYYSLAPIFDNAQAQYNLGQMYYGGQGVVQSYEKALEWFQKAADQRNADAQYNLGVMYHEGRGVMQSYEKALEWFQKAASQGYAAAQYNLGVMYRNGQGVAQSYEKTLKWFLKSANQGYAAAQRELGVMYHEGYGIKQSDEEARRWIQKAADQGLASAEYNLGIMYSEGQGVAQSYEKAFEWFQKAASQGYAAAQYNLGVMYHNGQRVAQSYEKALEWYQKAASQGDAAAQCNLGELCFKGQGVVQSYEKAFEWYQKAAEKGDAAAQCNLGELYFKGQGVVQSYEKAFEWYQKAAEKGDAVAQYNLGVMYHNGQEVLQFYQEALEKILNQRAADSVMYITTSGKVKNYIKSAEWLIKAAKQNNGDAQIMLAECYYLGRGVLKNESKAVKWLTTYKKREDLPQKLNMQSLLFIKNKIPQLLDIEDKSFDKICSRIILLQNNLVTVGNTPIHPFAEGTILNNIRDTEKGKASTEILRKYQKAAKNGNVVAQLKLGVLYHYGLGVTQDFSKAFEWYTEAAQQGNTCAQDLLSKAFINGLGTAKDEIKSKKWLLKAIDGNLINNPYSPLCPDEIRNGSFLYSKGDRSDGTIFEEMLNHFGDEIDALLTEHLDFCALPTNQELKVLNIYMKGAALENKAALHTLIGRWFMGDNVSEYLLGKLYADTWIERPPTITNRDIFDWLEVAVKEGDTKALYRLGRMYEYGWGTVKDDMKALECFKGAVEKGHAPAQKAVAEMYREGRGGLESSNRLAVKWYSRAGKQGDAGASAAIKDIADEENYPPAIYALARAHDEGWGIARDEDEAVLQYETAARLGYYKGQYKIVVQQLEGKVSVQEDLAPLPLLTLLAGGETRKNYLNLLGEKFNHKKEIKALEKLQEQGLPKEGYYKAQHKLAELYALGQAIPSRTIKDIRASYTEAIRLYKLAIKSNKPVPMAPLERVRFSLEKLEKLGEEERIKVDIPEFSNFLADVVGDKKLGAEFTYQLAFLFNEASYCSEKVEKKLQKVIESLLTLPESSKQTQGIMHMLLMLVQSKEFKSGLTQAQQDASDLYRLKELSTIKSGINFIKRPWNLIPFPSSLSGKVTVSQFLHDPRIEMFNSYFRQAESRYDEDLFRRSVHKILTLFDRLRQENQITDDSLKSEDDEGDSGNRKTLEKLLTHNHKPDNRFGHRLIRIADIVYDQYRKDPSLVASQLTQWAKRGLDCLTASEEETNRFYIEYITNNRAGY